MFTNLTAKNLAASISSALDILSTEPTDRLLANRHQRLMGYGVVVG